MVAQHLAVPRQSLVIGGDGSRFTDGAEILSGIEAEGRGVAHRPGLAPAALLLREVPGAMRLAGILDDDEVVPGRQVEDGIHVGHLPVEMRGDDCRHRAASALAQHAVGPQVASAFGLQIGAQPLGIHGIGALVDVDEIRPRAGLRDRLRSGDEGERHRHHGVSGPDTRPDQREAQGIRAARHSDAKPRVAELREVALKSLDHGTTDEPGGVERGLED